MSRTVRVSDRMYERIEDVKEQHDHLTMDGALREMVSDYTIRKETAERKHAFEIGAIEHGVGIIAVHHDAGTL